MGTIHKDSDGKNSWTRVYSSLSLLFSFFLSTYTVFAGALSSEALILIATYIVAAFAPKVVQKFAEKKVSANIPGTLAENGK